jgi:hypothetical protein
MPKRVWRLRSTAKVVAPALGWIWIRRTNFVWVKTLRYCNPISALVSNSARSGLPFSTYGTNFQQTGLNATEGVKLRPLRLAISCANPAGSLCMYLTQTKLAKPAIKIASIVATTVLLASAS